jgi:hypothetical protein
MLRTSREIRCKEHGGLKPLPDSTIVTMHATGAVTHIALLLLCYGLQLPLEVAVWCSGSIMIVMVAPWVVARCRDSLVRWRRRRSGAIELD